MNQFKTFLLMLGLVLLLMVIGEAVAGKQGFLLFGLIGMGMNFFYYWFSDRVVLAMYGGKELSVAEAPEVHRSLENLSQVAGLPKPRVYLIDSPAPNAFATGRNPENAVVAVTTGLLQHLSADEVEGVLGHELGHIKNRDILIQTVVAGLVSTVMMLARVAEWAAIFGGRSRDGEERGSSGAGLLVIAILAPLAAFLIQMAISRSREYLADDTGAWLCGNPLKLASALRKLDAYSQRVPLDASPATAHLFIVNPLRGSAFMKLFSTHPPIEERIRRLEQKASYS